MPGLIIFHADILALLGRQLNVVKGVARGQVGGGQVIITVEHNNLQPRVVLKTFPQMFGGVNILVLEGVVFPGLVQRCKDLIGQVQVKLQRTAQIIIHGAAVGTQTGRVAGGPARKTRRLSRGQSRCNGCPDGPRPGPHPAEALCRSGGY